MRLLKIVLTAMLAFFALAAGLLLAAGSIVLFGTRRLFRGSRPVSMSASAAPAARREPPGEIIDVTATEVRPDAPRIERPVYD